MSHTAVPLCLENHYSESIDDNPFHHDQVFQTSNSRSEGAYTEKKPNVNLNHSIEPSYPGIVAW